MTVLTKYKAVLIALVLIILGLLGILIAPRYSGYSESISGISISIFTAGLIGFAYEVSVGKGFLDDNRNSILEILNDKKIEIEGLINSEKESFEQKLNSLVSSTEEIILKEKVELSSLFEEEKKALHELVEKEKDEIKTILKQVIHDSIPRHMARIQDNGVVDSYKRLVPGQLAKHFDKLERKPIRIIKIWIPNLENFRIPLKNAIVQRDCHVKIALLNPTLNTSLEARASSMVGLDSKYIKSQIWYNLRLLRVLRDELPEDKKENLEVRLYDTIISLAMFGYGETFLIGFYLQEKHSIESMQIKVSGATSDFYCQLDNHFTKVWKKQSIDGFSFMDNAESEGML